MSVASTATSSRTAAAATALLLLLQLLLLLLTHLPLLYVTNATDNAARSQLYVALYRH